MKDKNRKYAKPTNGIACRVMALTLIIPCAAPLEAAGPASAPVRKHQTPAGQAVGSLTAAGTVLVNGTPAAADSTIFPGDTVRTTDAATAAFSLNGQGAFKLAPNTEMAFAGDPRFSGELKAGTVVMNSFGGATDISLRVGNYVVAPVIQAQQSASRIDRHPDGSYTVACLDGSVGLIPLEGATGRVLQSGESVNILATGLLEQTGAPAAVASAPETPAAATASAPPPAPEPIPPVNQKNSKRNEYILIGLAGAAAVGVAAGVAGAGHGSSSVSPSTP